MEQPQVLDGGIASPAVTIPPVVAHTKKATGHPHPVSEEISTREVIEHLKLNLELSKAKLESMKTKLEFMKLTILGASILLPILSASVLRFQVDAHIWII